MTAASWNDVFGAVPNHVQEIATALRGFISKAHPGVIETAKPGWGAVQFGFGEKNKDLHSYVMPQKDRINLGFYFGTSLPDPSGLLEGTGKSLRHVKVATTEQATSEPIAALIGAAVYERQTVLGVT